MMELVDKIKSGVAKPSALKLVNGTVTPRPALLVRVVIVSKHWLTCCSHGTVL